MTMPQLGETVTEGTITRWMKSIGEEVERDEPLFEVSTDKVDTEVPSPAAGVLSEIVVQVGDTVDVGTKLAVIGDGAGTADQPAPQASPAQVAPDPQQPPSAPPQPVSPAPPPTRAPAPAPPAPAAPQAPPAAPPVPPAFGVSAPERNAEQMALSPMVRRLLSEQGIDPSQLQGSGLGGRITRDDVLRFVEARRGAAAPGATNGAPTQVPAPVAAPAPAPPSRPPSSSQAVMPSAGDTVLPFTNVRRRTAEHMVRSKATSPHAFIATETDFENVERVRRSFGPRFKAEEGFSLTYLPFIARAAVEALREHPHLNASVSEDSLVVHSQINLGIAVDLDHEGLIVPVVHRAEEVTLRGIARRVRDLADRARSRQLGADDIAGGTFSITNDGPFGTYFTVPIINQPQVAILATDGIKRRPVVITGADGSESIAIHSVGVLGMSWDHRAVDGAYVSAFLRRMGELIATRDWSAEL
ncbi:MAG: dihydrolipoamide acetyltransferase family protein [Acidimicrobiales bacterium]